MTIREDLNSDDRSLPVRHYIDPGFVNIRLIETVIGEPGVKEASRMMSDLPDLPDHLRKLRINHIYTRIALTFCEVLEIRSLREVLAQGNGRMSCSTERLAPNENIYTATRLNVELLTPGITDYQVQLTFGTEHVCSSTFKSQIHQGADLSIIAAMPRLQGTLLTFQPLVIGSPWLETDDPKWKDNIIWWGQEFYEQFLEDFDQFALVAQVKLPTHGDALIMRSISEHAFKVCLGEILGEETVKDWGGEHSDHYTTHLTLRGQRLKGAFLLKGPARFSPMRLNHLGKNNDQIYRLAQEPADVLFIQHCHDITREVRETLRAFAVQPNRPRRYCVVDGRESLRLLDAYGKLDRALELSQDAA